jgi:hypothetical protein
VPAGTAPTVDRPGRRAEGERAQGAPRGTGVLGVTLACRTGGKGWEMKLDLQTVALVAIAAALWVAVFEGFNAF